jgi:hypothetical protein
MRSLTVALCVFIVLVVAWLAGSAGQLLGFGDRTSASVVLGLAALLALADLLLINRAGKTRPIKLGGMLACATFLVGVGLASAYRGYSSTPPYILERVAITARVYDVEGRNGRIETSVQLKILRGGLKDISWGGLGSTGVVKNVIIKDTGEGFKSEVMDKAGEWQLDLHFTEPTRVGQNVTFAFGFDVVDSPPEPDTYMVHDVKWPTENLQITIDVLKERPCETVEAYSEDVALVGADKRPEAPPLLFSNKTELQWSKAFPQEGRSYWVICHHAVSPPEAR